MSIPVPTRTMQLWLPFIMQRMDLDGQIVATGWTLVMSVCGMEYDVTVQ
jgi:hypothetical protein